MGRSRLRTRDVIIFILGFCLGAVAMASYSMSLCVEAFKVTWENVHAAVFNLNETIPIAIIKSVF